MLKKVLRTLGLVCLNLLLIFITIKYTVKVIAPLINTTENYRESDLSNPFLYILFLGILLFIFFKKFRPLGIGILLLTCHVLFSLFHLANRQWATEGQYNLFKTSYENFKDLSCVKPKIHGYPYIQIDVDYQQAIDVDSMEFRIDKGLFGIKFIADKVKIPESNYCKHYATVDSLNWEQHHKLGKELKYKRCFNNAIDHFKTAIDLDSTQSSSYKELAEIYLVQEDYKNALLNFYQAATIDFEDIETLDDKLKARINEGKSLYKTNNYEIFPQSNSVVFYGRNQAQFILQSQELYYMTRLNYCYSKQTGEGPFKIHSTD
tara:strand:+ start:1465 stop:2421 length:957 start_codon:yes stop_codon:yes gene_type:complete